MNAMPALPTAIIQVISADGRVILKCRYHRMYRAKKPPHDAECVGCKYLFLRKKNSVLKVVS